MNSLLILASTMGADLNLQWMEQLRDTLVVGVEKEQFVS